MDALSRQQLANSIRHLRLQQRLRQSDLTVPGVLARSTISALERGQILNPSETLLAALAQKLKVTQGELMGLSDLGLEAFRRLEEARRRLALEDHAGATKLLRGTLLMSRRLQLWNVFEESASLLAESYLKQGQPMKSLYFATASVLRVIRQDSTRISALSHLARGFQQLGEWEAAVVIYRQLLIGLRRTDTESARLRTNLATAYLSLGKFRRAEQHYRRSVDEGAQLGDAWLRGWALVGLGNALAHQLRFEEARLAIDQAKNLARTYRWSSMTAEADASLVLLPILSSPSMDEARQQLEEALALLPDLPPHIMARVNLLDSWAALAVRHQSWEEAITVSTLGIRALKSTRDPRGRYLKGRLLWFRSLAKYALQDPSSALDHEWASDLLPQVPGGDETLPPWPETPEAASLTPQRDWGP